MNILINQIVIDAKIKKTKLAKLVLIGQKIVKIHIHSFGSVEQDNMITTIEIIEK